MDGGKIIIMTKNNQSIETSYSRVKGLGSAKSGVKHWLNARLTAIPLMFLFFYFIWQIKYITTHDHAVFIHWVGKPINSIFLIFFIFCAFYHASLGIEEIVTDYVHSGTKKILALIFNKLLFLIMGIISIYSILSISFGA